MRPEPHAAQDRPHQPGGFPLLDAKAAGRLLGVPHTWLLKQGCAGRIPHHRLGHYVRFDAADLRTWLQEKQAPTAPSRLSTERARRVTLLRGGSGLGEVSETGCKLRVAARSPPLRSPEAGLRPLSAGRGENACASKSILSNPRTPSSIHAHNELPKSSFYGSSDVRLRRVGRELPSNQDLARARFGLEQQLGQTVSRRLAARLLGLSHTALERWVKSGDLAVVRSSTGREAIPVPALLDLDEAVQTDRAASPGRYALAPTITRQRDAARRMRLDRPGVSRHRDGHDRASARSLAYHRAVASKLSKAMVAEGSHVLFRWREQGRIDRRYAKRWEELLAKPLPAIRHSITAVGLDADDLRQNSPFAGALSEPERQRTLAEVS